MRWGTAGPPAAASPARLAARPACGKVTGAAARDSLECRAVTRTLSLLLPLALLAVPAGATDGGKLGTLPLGRYLCELPGDAAGPASVPVDGAWFDVLNASSYDTEGGSGTYLLTGEEVVFTRGPMKGARFERVSDRRLDRSDLKGKLAKMRCVRTGRVE